MTESRRYLVPQEVEDIDGYRVVGTCLIVVLVDILVADAQAAERLSASEQFLEVDAYGVADTEGSQSAV